jgi:hypothetical protein
VREDLPSSQKAVQAIHAAVEATRQGLICSKIEHPHLVLCSALDEATLERHSDLMKSQGIRHIMFKEPDRNNESTAIATEVVTAEKKKMLRKLRLLSL